ncbi:hypothetical protein P9112_005691 [Eukaryota sp. TZLM1-RC]
MYTALVLCVSTDTLTAPSESIPNADIILFDQVLSKASSSKSHPLFSKLKSPDASILVELLLSSLPEDSTADTAVVLNFLKEYNQEILHFLSTSFSDTINLLCNGPLSSSEYLFEEIPSFEPTEVNRGLEQLQNTREDYQTFLDSATSLVRIPDDFDPNFDLSFYKHHLSNFSSSSFDVVFVLESIISSITDPLVSQDESTNDVIVLDSRRLLTCDDVSNAVEMTDWSHTVINHYSNLIVDYYKDLLKDLQKDSVLNAEISRFLVNEFGFEKKIADFLPLVFDLDTSSGHKWLQSHENSFKDVFLEFVLSNSCLCSSFVSKPTKYLNNLFIFTRNNQELIDFDLMTCLPRQFPADILEWRSGDFKATDYYLIGLKPSYIQIKQSTITTSDRSLLTVRPSDQSILIERDDVFISRTSLSNLTLSYFGNSVHVTGLNDDVSMTVNFGNMSFNFDHSSCHFSNDFYYCFSSSLFIGLNTINGKISFNCDVLFENEIRRSAQSILNQYDLFQPFSLVTEPSLLVTFDCNQCRTVLDSLGNKLTLLNVEFVRITAKLKYLLSFADYFKHLPGSKVTQILVYEPFDPQSELFSKYLFFYRSLVGNSREFVGSVCLFSNAFSLVTFNIQMESSQSPKQLLTGPFGNLVITNQNHVYFTGRNSPLLVNHYEESISVEPPRFPNQALGYYYFDGQSFLRLRDFNDHYYVINDLLELTIEDFVGSQDEFDGVLAKQLVPSINFHQSIIDDVMIKCVDFNPHQSVFLINFVDHVLFSVLSDFDLINDSKPAIVGDNCNFFSLIYRKNQSFYDGFSDFLSNLLPSQLSSCNFSKVNSLKSSKIVRNLVKFPFLDEVILKQLNEKVINKEQRKHRFRMEEEVPDNQEEIEIIQSKVSKYWSFPSHDAVDYLI